MKTKMFKFLAIVLFSGSVFSQENDDYTKRLKAISNQAITSFNVDGVDFSSQLSDNEFSEKGLKTLYKKYSIKNGDIKTRDESLTNNNFYITKSIDVAENVSQINSYYFVENKNRKVSIIWFGYYGKLDKNFERKYVTRILNDEIPKEVFEPLKIDVIDFAGRKIKLGSSCYWTFVNTVQCPHYGEMNWSVHRTIEGAKSAVANQFLRLKNQKGGKILSEEEIDVIFEGTETKAKKVIYDFTGVTGLLVGMSGGKTLTIYYVASRVRENYVSCCMSFWNNDVISKNGLAPLLEEVMQLK